MYCSNDDPRLILTYEEFSNMNTSSFITLFNRHVPIGCSNLLVSDEGVLKYIAEIYSLRLAENA